MPGKRYLLTTIAVTALLLAVTGCGGSGNSLSFPPPQGGSTNADFSGPFAFSYTGSDGGGFLAAAGSFQADGAGHITSGAEDINLNISTGPIVNAPVTGTYVVRADGRGSITLNSPAGNTSLDFVLVAGGHALVTRFDANGTGSGTIDQQTTSAFTNTALAGSFAFSLSGIDTGGIPLGVAGNFTSDATGTLTAGVDDSNENGVAVTSDPMTGSIPVTASGRGTATLNTSRGALHFAFYVVDANHLKVVGIDSLPALGGEAFRQTGAFSNASLTGPFAFTLAGADVLSASPFAAGGILTSDGAGTISSGSEDFNDAGSISTNIGLTGTYNVAANGRGTLTMASALGTFTFVLYPSSGGVLVLETDARFLSSGTALQQTGTFSNATLTGTYGMNFSGATSNGEFDTIAQFTSDGVSKLSGITDLNNVGATTFGQPITGTFSAASNGRTTMLVQTPLGAQNLVVYMVDGTRALFVEIDPAAIAAGDIRHQ
ncbi:MAG TPA: hypothetical protein VGJ33_11380 [Candidatus Angelobacter sp.]